jgi:hypothetical protein
MGVIDCIKFMNKWSNKCVVHGVVIHIGKAKMNIFGEMG